MLPWCNALRLLHPTPLPQGERNCYRGRLRFANRPYSTLLAKPCQRGWRPLTLTLSPKGRGNCYPGAMRSAYCTLPLSRWGEGTVTADDYASLIDPTRPCLSRGRRKPRRGWNPRLLPQARDAGLASANDATAPGSRYHNAPLTLA